MKTLKNIALLALILSSVSIQAQSISYNEKLFIANKLYGHVKYFHSEISVCNVDWDSVVLANLPNIKNAATIDEFNDELLNLLDAAGPMAKAVNTPPVFDDSSNLYNLNYDWFESTNIRADVKALLDTIRIHFRPHPNCWVERHDYTGNYGYLIFPHDHVMYDTNILDVMPNEYERVLYTFKYCNIISYFNPYNYILEKPWDSTFMENIGLVVQANDPVRFYFAFKRFSAGLDDAHAEYLTSSYIEPPTYFYSPEILLKHIEGKYTVVASKVTAIQPGFVITAVNNISAENMEDSLRPYISAGNPSTFHNLVAQYLLNGYYSTTLKLDFIDNDGLAKNTFLQRNNIIFSNFFYSYYPNDTLADVSFRKINCDVGYVNMGVITNQEVFAMYNYLSNSKAIIFDIRNYPNGTIHNIANLMLPNNTECVKFRVPDVEYPGTFLWSTTSLGYNGNSSSYKGKVVIIVNEETVSHAEFTAMILKAMPDATIVGSQTVAADGNITYFYISNDLQVGFTSLGVYYPDGTQTQRIGIVPDVEIRPTSQGIIQKRDEVLEKALSVAGCWGVSVESLPSVTSTSIYPNPSDGLFNIDIETNAPVKIQVANNLGQIVYENTISGESSIDLRFLSNGLYHLTLDNKGIKEMKQIVIVK
jgi:carboxyl-terminal processing protease